MTRFWLDPKSSAHGETGKFFAYNVAEAKKLLSAAGFANGFPAVWQYAGNRYGKDFNDIAEASGQYLTSLGLQMTFEVQDYNSKYITQTSIGNFKGIAFGPETTFTEAGSYPIRLYTDNPKNRGKIRDAQLAKLAVDQQSESNEQKRREMFNEIQRINAQNMYYIPSQYRHPPLEIAQGQHAGGRRLRIDADGDAPGLDRLAVGLLGQGIEGHDLDGMCGKDRGQQLAVDLAILDEVSVFAEGALDFGRR